VLTLYNIFVLKKILYYRGNYMFKRILCSFSALLLSTVLLLPTQVEAAPLSKRLAGSNRYETSSKIALYGWTTSNYAVVASGEGFADALCSAPLAKKYNAPILLTGKNTLDSNTKAELIRLNVKNLFIVGGPGVVSDNIKNQLESMNIITTRIYGQNRFETSLQVAKSLGTTSGVVVTNGFGFADALSIAPVAAQKGMPILLTDKDDLSSAVKEFLVNSSYSESYIVGGSGVVSDKIASQLKNNIRLGGSSRYGTNSAVLNYFADKFSYDKVYIASGENYPDALSGSALAALSNSPLILVGRSIDDSVMSSIKAQHDKYKNIIVLGGTAVVADSLANYVVSGVINVTSISLNKTFDTLSIGGTDILIATAVPSYAENKAVVWSSSNNSVASVDSYGKVTAVSPGNAIITATTVDGNKAASCTVTVNGTTNQQYPITIEQLPIDITIENPDSIGNVYMDATYKNNSQKNVVGFTATVLLKDTNETTYLSNYDTVLPGETSPNFYTFGPKTLNKDDIQFLEYEIIIANADGSETYIIYDCKLKTYDINTYETDTTNTPPLTIGQLSIDININNPDSIGNVYMDATYKNNSQKNIVGFTATVLLKDTNEITYLSNYDTVLPGETSPNFYTFGPETLNKDDIQFLEYEIIIANADGSETYISYDCKLKTYKQY